MNTLLYTPPKIFFWILISAFLWSSCATILDGRKNTIKIEAGSPENAQIFLDGKYLGDTPFKTRVSKFDLQEGSIIEIKKEGYESMEYEVQRSPHVMYVGLDILMGVVPLFIDVADGNIYRPNTRKIEYELLPMKNIKKANVSSKQNAKQ